MVTLALFGGVSKTSPRLPIHNNFDPCSIPKGAIAGNESVVLDAVNSINDGLCVDCKSTNLFGAVMQAADEAVKQYNADRAISLLPSIAIAIFTDGNDEAGRKTRAEAIDALNAARGLTQQNLNVFTVGLGKEIDLQDLKALGQNGYLFAENETQLKAGFDQIAARVVDASNSYYAFEYCSPKRAGKISVLIQATNSTNLKGSFSFGFDASVFAPPHDCQNGCRTRNFSPEAICFTRRACQYT